MPSSSTAQQTSRHFATSSRVHPSYLPYLQAPKPPKVAKWIPPAVAIAGIAYPHEGYGVTKFQQSRSLRSAAQKADEADRKRRNDLMADAYGDRGSLEALEEACRVYESQQQRR
ncbi:hypothetical protein OOU_Y34scaffold00254g12 [Pyricularia oryzae Y34]|uniref:Uncharacterized protein n=2 Tax=Pyricularia oryzae TaxID=318829 RepID=A0AA97PP64_PYRO3|nr:hypothetical protein OOU_Y34scaffold00254g12 [Pyricularia oryzae Y34]